MEGFPGDFNSDLFTSTIYGTMIANLRQEIYNEVMRNLGSKPKGSTILSQFFVPKEVPLPVEEAFIEEIYRRFPKYLYGRVCGDNWEMIMTEKGAGEDRLCSSPYHHYRIQI